MRKDHNRLGNRRQPGKAHFVRIKVAAPAVRINGQAGAHSFRKDVIRLPNLSEVTTYCPNYEDLKTFFDCLFRHAHQDGIISLRTFVKNGTRDFPLWNPFPTVPVGGERGHSALSLIDHAAGIAANTKKAAVFCPPVATFKTAHSAKAEDLLEGLALSVECDDNPQAAIEKLESVLGPATVVVASGGMTEDDEPKLHGHWRLSKPTRTTGAHQALRELATNLIDADCSNKPMVHPIRWPGSWHRKGKPVLCKIVTFDPDAEIELDDALEKVKAELPAKPKSRVKIRARREPKGIPDHIAKLIREGVPVKQRSNKFHSVVWALANLEFDIDDIVAELEEYPDGIAQKYVKRLRQEVKRSYEDWVKHGGEEEDERPRILIRPGQLPHLIDEAQAALAQSDEQIYQRGDHMCHPVKAVMKAPDEQTTEQWKLHIVEPAYLTEKLTKVASFHAMMQGAKDLWR
jgi:hypothetical protein